MLEIFIDELRELVINLQKEEREVLLPTLMGINTTVKYTNKSKDRTLLIHLLSQMTDHFAFAQDYLTKEIEANRSIQ